jgi:translocation and assembly module TamA
MYNVRRLLPTLAALIFTTTVNAQVSVDVQLSGINNTLQTNVRLFLSIEQQKNDALMSEGRLRRLNKKAPQEIRQALQPYGYYRPVIETKLTQPTPDHWLASYTINPGPPLPIGEFNFTLSEAMRNDPKFQALIKKQPLHKGGTFNHLEYENFKSSLANLASERGYFNAHFVEHRVEIDLDAYEARIYLHYDGGPRYRFGEVHLHQDVLDPELLKRYIPFDQGDPYILDKMLDFQQGLNDSDYFQSVEVSPEQPNLDSDEIPIDVTLTPRKRHRFTLGLGYGADTGARASFGWEMPRLNRKGHRVDTEAKVSEIGESLVVHYRVPVLNPRTDQLVYSAGIVNETTDATYSSIRTIGVSLSRGRGDWRETLSLNYEQEKYIIADVANESTLLMPGVSWSRTWSKNFINTFDGLRFDIGVRGASKKLISDTDFVQASGGLKGIVSIGDGNRIIARGDLGTTWTQQFNQLPTSVRFFTGGSQSVRGYAYNSLGPVDANGQVVGGKYLMVGSIEFEHSLNGKWGVALFYDAGNAIDSFNDNLERGAGFGIRWKSPVGPVRIDLASALSRNGHPWRLHINIGPDL